MAVFQTMCVLHIVPADAKFVDDPEPEREDFLQRLRSYVRNQFKPTKEGTITIACNYNLMKYW
jgi:hypothetical protein